MRGITALSVALIAAACNEPTGPSRRQAVSACSNVGAALAMLEVGRDASTAQREPVAAKHTAACEAAKLTLEERECIARATSTWAAIDCAPRMFPKAPTPGTKAGCVPVVARMRAAIVADMPPDVGSAGAAMVDRMMQVAETSCIEDAWPEPFLACVMASKVGDMTSFKACHELLPAELMNKVQARMAAVQPAAGSGSATPPASDRGSPPHGSPAQP